MVEAGSCFKLALTENCVDEDHVIKLFPVQRVLMLFLAVLSICSVTLGLVVFAVSYPGKLVEK